MQSERHTTVSRESGNAREAASGIVRRDSGAAVAIIGMGCRIPGGVSSPAAFWELLKSGVDAITEVPGNRWKLQQWYDSEPRPGKTYARWGGFIDDVDRFDAAFFGVSPREAAAIDPQQRLLLQTAYEALEDGGQTPELLRGRRTGVYVGMWGSDYEDFLFSDPAHIDFYRTQGTGRYTAAGRLSFVLGLDGPSMAIDTACSSSLVTVHLACQSLRNGECELALAGGVNLLLQPQITIAYSQSRMMATDGRCRFGDASGSGYVRSEGVGLVLLKPLAAALSDGDPIYAVVRGSAVNNDGKSSGSFGTPGIRGQESMLRAAYQAAGVDPREVRFVEAHGTGTKRGDPVEVRALAGVLCEGRPVDRPLLIGSVKTNIGHMESAAGIGGLMKASLALSHREVPASLHFREPNPNIPFRQLPIQIPTEAVALPDDGQVHYAGVNSFGISGTNAHVVLAEAPAASRLPAIDGGRYILNLTARSPDALRALVGAYVTFLPEAEAPVADICYTLSVRRSLHPYRLSASGRSRAELIERLEAFLAEEEGPGLASGQVAFPDDHPPERSVAFVYSGQGSQWIDMGRDLFDREEVFRTIIEECDREIKQITGWSVIEELQRPAGTDPDAGQTATDGSGPPDGGASRLNDIDVMWPAIFAIQVATTEYLKSLGIRPAAVVGHSIGEAAAAWAAGALGLADAVRVIVTQARLVHETSGQGGMALVGLPFETVAQEIADREGPEQTGATGATERLVAAIEASPESAVVSGDPDAIDELVLRLEERGVFARKINTPAAVHSAQMEPLKERLLAALSDLQPQRALIPFYSATFGAVHETGPAVGAATAGLGADYWWQNLRRPVLFATAIDAIFHDGPAIFLEISPHPIVTVSVQETIRGHQSKGFAISTLRRGEAGLPGLGRAISEMCRAGAAIDLDEARRESVIRPLLLHDGRPRVAFVFSGQGPQWWAMGRELLEKEPVFRRKVEEIDALLARHADWSLLAELTADEDRSRLGETRFAQPAIFALQVGLAELWQSCGVSPDAITGHSVGEVAAAHVSGKLTLEQAVRVIYHRGRLMQDATGLGKMAAIEAPLAEAREFIRGYEDLLAIGAANSPTSTVLSGETGALEEVLAKVEAAGVYQKLLPVNYAFHSPQMEPFKRQMNEAMADLSSAPARVPIVSTVSGELASDEAYGADYWGDNIREGVMFASAIDALVRDGFELFLEIGPHPVLCPYILQCLERAGRKGHAVPSLRRNQPEHLTLLGNLGTLFTLGYPVDWRRVYTGPDGETGPARGQCVRLPTYPWQLERFWIDPPASAGSAGHEIAARGESAHPLLQRKLDTAEPVFTGELDSATGVGMLAVRLYPVAVWLDALLAAARYEWGTGTIELSALKWLRYPSARGENCGSQIILTQMDDAVTRMSARVYDSASTAPDNPEWFRNLSAELSRGPAVGASIEIPATFRGRMNRRLSGEEVYSFLADQEYQIPEALRSIRELETGEGEFLVSVSPRGEASAASGQALEAGFQVLNLLCMQARGSAGIVYLPRRAHTGRLFDRMGGFDLSAPTVYGQLTASDDGFSGSLRVYDARERCVLELERIELVAMNRAGLVRHSGRGLEDWLYAPAWEPVALLAAGSPDPGQCLIFADDSDEVRSLADELSARRAGQPVVLVRPGSEYRLDATEATIPVMDPEPFKRLLTECGGKGEIAAIVYMWGLQGDEHASRGGDWRAVQERGLAGLLHLSQALEALSPVPRLVVVTRGAQAVQSAVGYPRPEQATLWGAAAVIEKELPGARCLRIDLDPTAADAMRVIADEILAGAPVDCVGYRNGRRFEQRLVSVMAGDDAESSGPGDRSQSGPLQLDIRERGILDNLYLRPATRSLPEPGQVEIEIEATGLNFRDVLSAMNLYAGGSVPFGVECAGRVSAIGENVEDLHVGDEVIAISPEPCFASFVRVSADLIVKKPAKLSFVEAATIPAVFLTCYYALHHLARITDRDRVLIHSAAGGVGLAAIQLAKLAGAEVFATCSTDEKRAYLRSLGVKHIFDSRSFDYVDQIRELTNGEGVDVVLNSLSGEFIRRNISLLRENGRYLEIGKKDILSAKEVHQIKRRVSYFLIDLMEIAERQPDLIQSMLLLLAEEFEAARLAPLPVTGFPMDQAAEAFRFMARGKHIGKIIVTRAQGGAAPVSFPGIRPDASYLITGGLGDLGLLFARDLAEQGAKDIVLTGRRGAAPEVQARLDALAEETGARFTVIKGDIAQEEDVVRILTTIDRELPALRGIVHAAGVLDDGALAGQNWDRFVNVLQSKVGGSLYLHRHTQRRPLDFFVMFSSIASLLGLRGQISYAAANAFMDSLAAYRSAAGLPGLSIHWGPWADVGMVAQLEAELLRSGIDPLPPAVGLAAWRKLIGGGHSQVGVIHMNWPRFLDQFAGRAPGFYRNFVNDPEGAAGHAGSSPSNFLEELHAAPGPARHRLVFEHVRGQLAKILGMNPAAVDTTRGFKEMGLDSLMTVELRNRLQASLNATLPSTLAFDYPNAGILTDYITNDVVNLSDVTETGQPEQKEARQTGAPTPSAGDITVDGLVRELGAFSDEDALAALLGN